MRPGDDEESGGKKPKKTGAVKQRLVDDELLEAALAAAQSQEEQNRLFDELSELNLSAVDSDVSDDADSLRSTAKPTLRPFFTSKAVSEDTLHTQTLPHGRPSLGNSVQLQMQKRTSATLPPNVNANDLLRDCVTPPLAPATPTAALEQVSVTLACSLLRGCLLT